jgi:hypothetical protein
VLLCGGLAPAQSLGRPVPAARPGGDESQPVRQAAQFSLPPVTQRTALFQRPVEGDDISEFLFELELPSEQRVFGRLESEESLDKRIIAQEKGFGKPAPTFPTYSSLSKDQYFGRKWPQQAMAVEPNYAYYGRLYFEQKNFERYGWDLGVLAPVLESAVFLKDFVMLPYHIGTDPLRCYEASAGYCLPGDPVPLLLYPPELSATGAVAEAATILTLVAIFP